MSVGKIIATRVYYVIQHMLLLKNHKEIFVFTKRFDQKLE